MSFKRTTTLILVGCIALFGCKKKEEAPPPETVTPAAAETPAPAPTPTPVPFKVTSIDLGKAIGADKKVTDATTTFGPKDTIYAVVSSEGDAGPAVKLTAKWTFGDKNQSVKDEDQTVTPNGSAGATEFHVSKPKGWPVGKYKVEILADGTSAGTKEFEVKK
ncbi:MAG TPA: hypothetical protein VF173_02450 [Thermoanaerobaculia bacterium]|nr:hypothetical protein [Thermoanaerobaculia bacterium]